MDTLDRFKVSPPVSEDTLIKSERPVHFQVAGSVCNRNANVYNPKATVSAYLKKADGFTRDACERDIHIFKVDGAAISKRESNREDSLTSWGKGCWVLCQIAVTRLQVYYEIK